MTTQQQYIEQLKSLVAKKFGRDIISTEDCVALAEAIGETPDNELIIKALGIIFSDGENRGYAPRPALLSALARYIGYSGWSDFCTSPEVIPAIETNVIPVTRRWGVIIVTILAILIVVSTVVYLLCASSHTTDATPRPTLEQATRDIAEQWHARTLEECNTVRYYAGRRNYEEQVESFVEEYETNLTELIQSDIENLITERGLHFTEAEIEAEAEAIAEECRAVYRCL